MSTAKGSNGKRGPQRAPLSLCGSLTVESLRLRGYNIGWPLGNVLTGLQNHNPVRVPFFIGLQSLSSDKGALRWWSDRKIEPDGLEFHRLTQSRQRSYIHKRVYHDRWRAIFKDAVLGSSRR